MGAREQDVQEDAMLEFELRWFDAGGGPDHEIRERFGLSPTEFFGRLHDLLEAGPPAGIEPQVVEIMKGVARRRRWLAR